MAQTIVNLTLPTVADKIDDILSAYPLYEYRQIFSVPELHQKLTAYVLARLPMIYVTMDSSAACDMTSTGHCYSSEQHAQIDQLIHQGINALLGRPDVWQRYPSGERPSGDRPSGERPSPGRIEAESVPSSWFG